MTITNENYFSQEAQMKYIGSSQFKAFDRCEAGALAEIKGEYEREKTTSLLVGSYVDAHFEGTLDLFKAKNPEIFTRSGDLKSEYKKAENIIQRIERDRLFTEFMSGEKQVIKTGEIEGVPVKIKMDSYFPGDKIVDLKIMKDFAPVYVEGKGRLNFIEAWGYDIQGAIYREVVRQNTGETLPFVIAAATKENETDIELINVDSAALDVALDIVKDNIKHFDDVKKAKVQPARCEHCDYCKFTKRLSKIMTLEELNAYGYSD